MVDAQQLLMEVQKLVVETSRGTPQETADAFNKRLADIGISPEAVAAIGQSLGVAWNMQRDMRPEEGIAGALTVGLLLGDKNARGGF